MFKPLAGRHTLAPEGFRVAGGGADGVRLVRWEWLADGSLFPCEVSLLRGALHLITGRLVVALGWIV